MRFPCLKESQYRPEMLGVESLELRRLKLDLVFVYKVITFGLVDIDHSAFFTLCGPEVETRQHSQNYRLVENFGKFKRWLSKTCLRFLNF